MSEFHAKASEFIAWLVVATLVDYKHSLVMKPVV